MEDITKLFYLVDDFCKDIEKIFADKLLPSGKNLQECKKLHIGRLS